MYFLALKMTNSFKHSDDYFYGALLFFRKKPGKAEEIFCMFWDIYVNGVNDYNICLNASLLDF